MVEDTRLPPPEDLRAAIEPERVNEFETVVGGILCSVRAGTLAFGELAARWWRLGDGGLVAVAWWWRLGGLVGAAW